MLLRYGVIFTLTTFVTYVSTKDFKDRKKFEGKQKAERCALNDFISMHHFGYGMVPAANFFNRI